MQRRRHAELSAVGSGGPVEQVPGLVPVETWTTGDLRPGGGSERWLNTLLGRTEAAWAGS